MKRDGEHLDAASGITCDVCYEQQVAIKHSIVELSGVAIF